MANPNLFTPNRQVFHQFTCWIKQPRFDPQHAQNWMNLYQADPEAAMCEATFWAILHDCGVEVEPNTDLKNGRQAPDFACRIGSSRFYVEATCIKMETAARRSGLEAPGESGNDVGSFTSLNEAICQECRDKANQCASLDAPCLLAIGTFHYSASALVFERKFVEQLLTGEPYIVVRSNPRTDDIVSAHQETSFRSAAFTRIDSLDSIRCSISGLLLGGFGCQPSNLHGVLHPGPARAFDWRLLRHIPFARRKLDTSTARVDVEWLTDHGSDAQL